MPIERSLAGLHPHRTGFCDGLFNRPCESPFTKLGWRGMKKTSEYINAYMQGQEARANGAGLHITKNYTDTMNGKDV